MARVKTVLSPRGVASASSYSLSVCIVALMLIGLPSVRSQKSKMDVDLIDGYLRIRVGGTTWFNLVQLGEYNTTLSITVVVQHPDIVAVNPTTLSIPGSSPPNHSAKKKYLFSVTGKVPGLTEVLFDVTPEGYVNDSVFFTAWVMISKALYTIAYIVGWIYFAVWSVSFYPQIFSNFKRKNVEGLSFDFLTLNLLGFVSYSLFNCGLYFLRCIQEQYFERFPRGHNPVMLNDVFFSVHAALATMAIITQCFIYERGDQRVSNVARVILAVFFGIMIIALIMNVAGVMAWLDFIYGCSCIKLIITFIKYLPQAYMNYKRKSTVGWSIADILLDFTGGFLSILQMMLNAYNYDDWASFFGDFAKFGLGAFSLFFDTLFMLQHYVFYKYVRGFKGDTRWTMPDSKGRKR